MSYRESHPGQKKTSTTNYIHIKKHYQTRIKWWLLQQDKGINNTINTTGAITHDYHKTSLWKQIYNLGVKPILSNITRIKQLSTTMFMITKLKEHDKSIINHYKI